MKLYWKIIQKIEKISYTEKISNNLRILDFNFGACEKWMVEIGCYGYSYVSPRLFLERFIFNILFCDSKNCRSSKTEIGITRNSNSTNILAFPGSESNNKNHSFDLKPNLKVYCCFKVCHKKNLWCLLLEDVLKWFRVFFWLTMTDLCWWEEERGESY